MANNKQEDTPEDIHMTDDVPDSKLPMDEPDTEPASTDKNDEPETPVEKEPTDATKPAATPNKFKQWIHSHKKLSMLYAAIIVLVIAAVIVALTDARFAVMNLFLKASANVTVVDEKTHQPIPNAKVTIDNVSAQTDKKGVAMLAKIQFGPQTAKIEKDAYASLQTTIRIESSPQKASVNLHPTGTPLTFTVTNKISAVAIKGVKVTFNSSDALTNDKGVATLNVPPQSVAEVEVTLSADGYNTTTQKVKIDQATKNTASLTPSGKLYFLSKRTGKINVMSANLDGTDAAVIIPGTGKENDTGTTLLASRDWKFLALKASRDSDKDKIYLIDTSNNQMTTVDEGDAIFSSIGWHNHDFVYTVDRNTVQYWQPNKLAVKSYSADTKSLKTLDQNGAEGSQVNYSQQDITNFYIVKDGLVYSRSWGGSTHPAEIMFASTDGKQKKAVKTFDTTVYNFQARLYEPEGIYFAVYNPGKTTYVEYQDGAVKDVQISDNDFGNKFYPTYLVSPSG
ncbi:MAG TPA: hypothetical protein VH144_02540, partial [Candidatus Saccharimonadales bacterium]|nr:hypothetical protein [Candidatus Saccharimonadales bacterium]